MGWMGWLFFILGNWYFWPFIGAILYAVVSPFIRALRTWQAKSRFIHSQGQRLQNPQNAEARFQLANIYAEGRSWRRALGYAKEAVRVAEENPLYEGQVPYHFTRLLGDACYQRGLYGEACEAYQRALGVKSDLGQADAKFGLGKAFFRRGELEKSLEVTRSALEDNGSNLEGYFRFAQAAAGLNRPEDVRRARAEFWRVSASLPRFAGKSRVKWRIAFLAFPIARHFV